MFVISMMRFLKKGRLGGVSGAGEGSLDVKYFPDKVYTKAAGLVSIRVKEPH
jgi:hypothetical protein